MTTEPTNKPAESKPAEDKPAEVKVQPTMEQLKADLNKAIQSGNDVAFNAAFQAIAKRKSEIAKEAAAQALKEQEALAGIRAQTSASLLKTVQAIPNLNNILADVKANGFTYTPRGTLDVNGVPQTNDSLALKVPVLRKSSSGGSGGAGKTKAEYGMSLDEVYDKYANDEDKAKFAKAVEDAGADKKQLNSKTWQIKNAVKTRAIAEGTLVPVK